MSSDNPWILRYHPRPDASVRLFCFPHAGSSAAAFGPWASRVPDTIELCAIEYPGRGTRRGEPPFVRMHALVAALLDRLTPELERPFAIFGHSMGALIGFEFARQLQRHAAVRPVALVVAGCSAPGIPSRKPPLHSVPDEELLRELQALNGTPDDILFSSEMTRLFLPSLRADYELVDTYAYRAAPRCRFPIFAYGGADDRETPPADLDAWTVETDDLVIRLFAGDHFFLRTAQDEVLNTLTIDLGRALERDAAVASHVR